MNPVHEIEVYLISKSVVSVKITPRKAYQIRGGGGLPPLSSRDTPAASRHFFLLYYLRTEDIDGKDTLITPLLL